MVKKILRASQAMIVSLAIQKVQFTIFGPYSRSSMILLLFYIKIGPFFQISTKILMFSSNFTYKVYKVKFNQ